MNKFVNENQKQREDFIRKWAKIVRENKSNWREEHTRFINSQILQAQEFYDNLLKTKHGAKKVIKKFNITNKRIIKRLENQNINLSSEKLIIKEHKEFRKV